MRAATHTSTSACPCMLICRQPPSTNTSACPKLCCRLEHAHGLALAPSCRLGPQHHVRGGRVWQMSSWPVSSSDYCCHIKPAAAEQVTTWPDMSPCRHCFPPAAWPATLCWPPRRLAAATAQPSPRRLPGSCLVCRPWWICGRPCTTLQPCSTSCQLLSASWHCACHPSPSAATR